MDDVLKLIGALGPGQFVSILLLFAVMSGPLIVAHFLHITRIQPVLEQMTQALVRLTVTIESLDRRVVGRDELPDESPRYTDPKTPERGTRKHRAGD